MLRSTAITGLFVGTLAYSPTFGQDTTGATTPAFSKWSTFCVGVEHTTAIALGDLDGDGDLDLIFGNGRHLEETDWVYSNNGHGGFYAKRALGTEADPTYGVALGDLDGDGALDVVVANDTGDPSVAYRNDGKGNFRSLGNIGRTVQPRRAVSLGDLDGDGDLDVVLVGVGQQDHIYLNDGGGRRWTERVLASREGAGGRATGLVLGDVDGDNDLDIVLPGRYEAPSVVYMNDGKAGFAEARPFGSDKDDTTSVGLADIDGDGDLDIVATNWVAPHAIYVNDGRGRFTPLATFGNGLERSWSVAMADIDPDGDVDAVVGNANIDYWAQDRDGDGSSDVIGDRPLDMPSRVYLNDGQGRLTAGPSVGFGHDNTRPIALGDVDGDGDIDIVMGNDCQPNNVFFNPIREPRAKP